MPKVKKENLESWARNFLLDLCPKQNELAKILSKEEMAGLLVESTRIIKQLLERK